MRPPICASLLLALPLLGGCMTGPQNYHYDIVLKNRAEAPVTVEILSAESGGASKVRADLPPGGQYSGQINGYGSGYIEARLRRMDDSDKDRYYIYELPRGNVHRQVESESGRLILKHYAAPPGDQPG